MAKNDREKLIDTMAESQKFFDENGYWPTTYVPRTSGKPTQKTCGNSDCYCSSPDRSIFRDIQRGTVPDGALLKSCCWSKICSVRWKYRSKVGIHSETWHELCTRMGTVRNQDQTGSFRHLVVREPLLEVLKAARDKGSTP